MKIKIKKLYNDSKIPIKMSEKAGAYDIFCHSVEKLDEDFYICKTGIAMTPPEGYRICLVPRSSLTKYKWILGNHFGIGDEDFSGEYQFRFRGIPKNYNDSFGYRNFSYEDFPFKEGDRIGQIFLEEVIPIEFEEVEELSETERSNLGFGSSGK